ncbi:hypothetical protein SAMN02744133_12025 [Thalassospira xiamenensis M-5 = DSM 17429]|uniref:Uncharacterized protein n=1 Tax=Thalassospira xiamenensis M-5 = DSM 17429 TaxID=1123366 RepID=A0AB72UBT3_9PROT|nr:hypothetical protein [Thalassospira xiamenensis]AJD51614.1 hypothetical protein TH3_07470 [Thalassospira xiamenensis M-5 = DSM 17429]SIT31637.1 hypothetical protein SAMN02744133_12025 [Thalassospira xiamenensis M-5 = DSM 17429]
MPNPAKKVSKKGGGVKIPASTIRRLLRITGDRDILALKIGDRISASKNGTLLVLKLRDSLKPDVLARMTREEKKNGKKFRSFRSDKDMNRVFRAAEKNQDELFSTALTRNIVKGFKLTDMAKDWDAFKLLVDLMSSVRISTSHSGYSLKTEVMQHPTRTGSGLFGDPHDTASNHALMDARRRAYVTHAMQDAIDANLSRMEIAKIGVRAAIEYTLNHFTAPVTADDVYPHSRLKKVMNLGKDSSKAKEQLRSREQMKDQYEKLGGSLRLAIPTETPAQSLTRPWRRDNTTPLQGDDTLVEPPSPRRAVI